MLLARVQVTEGSMFELSVDVFPLHWKSGDSVEFEVDYDRRIRLIEVLPQQTGDLKYQHILEYVKSSGDGKYLLVGGNQQYFLINMDEMRLVESSGICRRGKFTSSDIMFSRQDRYIARLTSSGILALNDLTLSLQNNLLPTIIPKSAITDKNLQTWIEFTLDDKYLIYVDFKQETINMYTILEGKYSKTIYLPHHVSPVNISWDDIQNTRLTVTARVHQNADVFVFLVYPTHFTENPAKIMEAANSGIILEKHWHDLGLIKTSQIPQNPTCFISTEAFLSWTFLKHTLSNWINDTTPKQPSPSTQPPDIYFRLLLHPAGPLPFANLAVLPLCCLSYIFALLFADTNTHLQACIGLLVAFAMFLKSSTLMRLFQSIQELRKPKNAKLPYATILGATCLISGTCAYAFWFENISFFGFALIRGLCVYAAFVLVLMLFVFLSGSNTEDVAACAIHLTASVFKMRARASETLTDSLILAGRFLCRGTNNWFDRNSPYYGIATLKPCSTSPGPEDRVFPYHEHVIDEMVGRFLSQKVTNTTENTSTTPVEEQKYNERLQTVERQANSLSEAADKQITSFQSAIVSLNTNIWYVPYSDSIVVPVWLVWAYNIYISCDNNRTYPRQRPRMDSLWETICPELVDILEVAVQKWIEQSTKERSSIPKAEGTFAQLVDSHIGTVARRLLSLSLNKTVCFQADLVTTCH